MEPDPEEKDENYKNSILARDDRIITNALYNSVIRAQYELEKNAVFNVHLSGTTFTSVFFSGNLLYTANVGDSRSILISQVDDNQSNVPRLRVKQLTTDHKPDSQKERDRINNMGGRVAQAQDFRG